MSSKIALQGICYDAKSSFLRGSSQAPALIREALYDGSMNLYTESGNTIENAYHDFGDYSISDYFEIESVTEKNLRQIPKIISLGGDHSISYPILKAYASAYERIDILHIDAHADLYDEFEGDPYSHACPFARILDNNLAHRLVQVGIRTLTTHQKEQADKYEVEIHPSKNFSIENLSSFENPVYISLDLDGIDPAYAPGVSHHEPGGLTTRTVIDLIHHIDAEIIGADIVEYNPKRDIHNMTAYLAAKLLKEIIGKMLSS